MEQDTSKFTIIRAKDGKGLMEAGCMTVAPWGETARAGMDRVMAAGASGGEEVKILVDIPGSSIANVWFKHGYPLPLHRHSADCRYYFVVGTTKLGTAVLGLRDKFFMPSGVPCLTK